MRSVKILAAVRALGPVLLFAVACDGELSGTGGGESPGAGGAGANGAGTGATGTGGSGTGGSGTGASGTGASGTGASGAGGSGTGGSGTGGSGTGGSGTGGSGTGGSGTGGSGTGGSGTGGSGTGGSGSGSGGEAGSGGSATSGGGGAGGGPPAPPYDACPGEDISLGTGDIVSFSATTLGLVDELTPFCSAAGAPDAVYHVTLTTDCVLSVSVTDSGGLDAVVGIRRNQCGSEIGGDLCLDSSIDDEQFQHFEHAGSFWMVVDGANGSSGDFSVDIVCDESVCGDGILGPGEQCDVGIGAPLDGCGDPGAPNQCQVEAADAADTCAQLAAPFSIPAGASMFPAVDPLFSSADATDDYLGPCAPSEVGGKDEVFAFVPQATGTMTITVGADRNGIPFCQTWTEQECWDRFVFVREADCSAGADLGCNEIDFNTGLNVLTFSVTQGQTYYMFVDGLNAEFYSMGPYLISFDLQ